MLTLIIGIILGWLIPRPTWFGNIESRIWSVFKTKSPNWLRWWN